MVWSWSRRQVRDMLLSLWKKIGETDDGRQIVTNTLAGMLDWKPRLDAENFHIASPPYPELGKAKLEDHPCQRKDVIIISGRFRSGSTLLWNLFRHCEGVTSYYEPFNERRWFDPTTRGSHTDSTHRNAEEYWREYEGLTSLGQYYQEEWIERCLYMDENAWNPGMKRYVEELIENASGRPVLQFNRIDFRLPWFRRNFPGATIVHLFRHPRDQWCSTLMDIACFGKDAPMASFSKHDEYYLRTWAADLKYHFPFLDERASSHPYQMFYYLWKLSYLFGRVFAHHSICFEELVLQPRLQLEQLLEKLDIHSVDVQKLEEIISPPTLGKWRRYADEEWFLEQETICENTLVEFGLGSLPAGNHQQELLRVS